MWVDCVLHHANLGQHLIWPSGSPFSHNARMEAWQWLGQGPLQLEELGLAFVLSALIGLEREIRHKSAGFRTYTVVGIASALIMLVSKYGFMNILVNNRVVLDPSRIAAQIVTGIGFIGGGLIFVRRTNVRGLTTAAIVWLTAAVGMACGAGLPVLALAVTMGHFVIVFAFPPIAARLPRSRWAPSLLQITYEHRREILQDVLLLCTKHGFSITRLEVERSPPATMRPESSQELLNVTPSEADTGARATVILEVVGAGSVPKLAAKLTEVPGVISTSAGDANVPSD